MKLEEAKIVGFELDSINNRIKYLEKNAKRFVTACVVVIVVAILVLIMKYNHSRLEYVSSLLSFLLSFGCIISFNFYIQSCMEINAKSLRRNELIAKLELYGYICIYLNNRYIVLKNAGN